MIEKVKQFLEAIGAETDVVGRMIKCQEEDEELNLAWLRGKHKEMISETCDRIITGYALLAALGGDGSEVERKMAEVKSRPEYGGVR